MRVFESRPFSVVTMVGMLLLLVMLMTVVMLVLVMWIDGTPNPTQWEWAEPISEVSECISLGCKLSDRATNCPVVSAELLEQKPSIRDLDKPQLASPLVGAPNPAHSESLSLRIYPGETAGTRALGF